jgi:hypothetical protein
MPIRGSSLTRVLPIGNEPPFLKHAPTIQTELRARQIRGELDVGSDHMKAKIPKPIK